MLYKLISLAMALAGILWILLGIQEIGDPYTAILEFGSAGFCTLLTGMLNFVYIYETPDSPIGKYILLGCNMLYIGFGILMIGQDIAPLYYYITCAFALLCSILVMNRKTHSH